MPDYFATPLEAPVWVASYAELLVRSAQDNSLLQEVAANLAIVTRAASTPARDQDIAWMHAERHLTARMVGPNAQFPHERLANQNILHLNMLVLLDEAAARTDHSARRQFDVPQIGNRVWKITVNELDRMQRAWLGQACVDPELVERFTRTIAPLADHVAKHPSRHAAVGVIRPSYAALTA